MKEELLDYLNMLNSKTDKVLRGAAQSINNLLEANNTSWEEILFPTVVTEPPPPPLTTQELLKLQFNKLIEDKKAIVQLYIKTPNWKSFEAQDPIRAAKLIHGAPSIGYYMDLVEDVAKKGFLTVRQIESFDNNYLEKEEVAKALKIEWAKGLPTGLPPK